MAAILSTTTKQITKVRSVDNFTITVPDDGAPDKVTATFVEIDKDDAGNVLSRGKTEVFEFSQAEVEAKLAGVGLPTYSELRTKLATLLHTLRAGRVS